VVWWWCVVVVVCCVFVWWWWCGGSHHNHAATTLPPHGHHRLSPFTVTIHCHPLSHCHPPAGIELLIGVTGRGQMRRACVGDG
jgi:hypothetical protein